MSTVARWRSDPVDWEEPGRAVVVGVDGSPSNEAAVEYAVRAAAASARPLALVAVAPDHGLGIPRPGLERDPQWTVLSRITGSLAIRYPRLEVRRELQAGDSVPCLLDRSVGQGLLVVGKRRLGTFGRLLRGSTSIGVAGRSRVPVVVVPAGWEPARHGDQPVVVGVDPDQDNTAALRYGFAEAERRRVGLVVVTAFDDLPGPVRAVDVEATDVRDWTERGAAILADIVRPVRQDFPTVRVQESVRGTNPASALVETAVEAQLLVVGRHHSGRHGFGLGSVARAVLHYAGSPVAVVPSTD